MQNMTNAALAPQVISIEVLQEKYCKGDEKTQDEVFRRVAKGIAAAEKTEELREIWEERFYQNLCKGALGAGRIMSAAGTEINATLNNCYVMPVGDTVQGCDEDGTPGIYESLRMAAETMRRGGGVGYNFSKIRPANAFVKGTHSFSSGPCSYIDVFDASGKTVESAGGRRGAQLGALNVNHPDIEEFIVAKRKEGRWNSFNVSVYVTDDFMDAVKSDSDWQLIHKARPSDMLIEQDGVFQREDGMWVYKTVKAVDLWNKIMRSNYEFAEPGILFGDNINRSNNLNYCEVILATNPCGEQPLPDYGCCDLGPIDLTRFVKNAFKSNAEFDFVTFREALIVQTRFLDNVLDVTYWPLPEQQEQSRLKRRIGVGFTGLGNALAMLGIVYYSDEGVDMAERIAKYMAEICYDASVDLAIEKGAFPLFDAEKFLADGTTASRLSHPLKERIRKYGIRNSHLLSIAPVGTVSLAFCDNASNGIEPPFSLAYNRRKRINATEWTTYTVLDHGLRVFLMGMENHKIARAIEDALCNGKKEFEYENETHAVGDFLPKSIVTAMDMKATDHLRVMAAVQKWICTSISKTVNVPVDYPYEDFKNLYMEAYRLGCKGLSTYRPNAVLGSVLSEIKSEEPKKIDDPVVKVQAETLDDFYNRYIEKRPDDDYQAINRKVSYMTADGKNSFFVSVSYESKKLIIGEHTCEVSRPLEVFVTASPDSVPAEWVNIFGRHLSLLARSGLKMFLKALDNCRKVRSDKGRIRYDWYVKADGTRVPRFHDSDIACMGYVIQEILKKINVLNEYGQIKDEKTLIAEYNRNNSPAAKLIETVKEAAIVSETRSTQIEDSQPNIISGKKCEECGAHAVIKKDGCNFCTNCGWMGSCG